MSTSWKKFENDCFDYLKKNHKGVKFEPYGKSDSTKADIKVETRLRTFYIEVKSSSSQCCQFVLFPNEKTRQFDFSSGNKIDLKNKNILAIINYMNNNFETYKNVSTSGINIPLNSSIFYGLVADFCGAKNVAFFMTRGSEYIIFPSDSFSNYFNITACYRKKDSGSSEPNEAKNKREIENGLERDLNGEFCVDFCNTSDGKKRCILHSDKSFDKKEYFVIVIHTILLKMSMQKNCRKRRLI